MNFNLILLLLTITMLLILIISVIFLDSSEYRERLREKNRHGRSCRTCCCLAGKFWGVYCVSDFFLGLKAPHLAFFLLMKMLNDVLFEQMQEAAGAELDATIN